MQARTAQEEEIEYDEVRRTWCVGSEEFRKELLDSRPAK
jgi:hypothetical protein